MQQLWFGRLALTGPSAMVGNIFLQLAVEGSSADIRRLAVTTMNSQAPKLPDVINRIVAASLRAYLTKDSAPAKAQAAADDAETKAVSKEGRLCAFLISCAAVGQDVDRAVREKLAVDLVVLSHHPAIGTFMAICAVTAYIEIQEQQDLVLGCRGLTSAKPLRSILTTSQ